MIPNPAKPEPKSSRFTDIFGTVNHELRTKSVNGYRAFAAGKGETVMNRGDMLSAIISYFQNNADVFNIDMAFLYGSWAFGQPKGESDVDIAVLFAKEMKEEEIFEIITTLSLELTYLLKTETNILFIDGELSKPMLHYNAIVHGIPVYTKDYTGFVDTKLRAIHQMEDFRIFGTKWQSEIVKKRMEALNHA
jgi:predicted nucleotidyltransferase